MTLQVSNDGFSCRGVKVVVFGAEIVRKNIKFQLEVKFGDLCPSDPRMPHVPFAHVHDPGRLITDPSYV
jgi:hypothetical protein